MGWQDWWDYFQDKVLNVLTAFGLYIKHGKLIYMGLDNAGKTTLLRLVAEDKIVAHAPTQRATHETLDLGPVKFECYDLGGHTEARETWKDYYVDADAIVFMVDAYDRARFLEAKKELDSLLTATQLREVPMIVLGNKIDLHGAASEMELRQALGLTQTTGKGARVADGSSRAIEVFMCSVINRTGFKDGFEWLSNFL